MLRRPVRIACAAGLLSVAVVLRVWSFQWNDRLQGDVNLFALTARSFVEGGSLSYPLKYEFSDRVDYCTERSVASQHPPLIPLVAGLVGRALGSDETYTLLKGLSEFGAALLLALLAVRAVPPPAPGALAALALVGASPMLVDFSGNGSPYVWCGLLLLLSTILLGQWRLDRARDFALAGILSGVAPQVHPALLAVPASFLVLGMANHRRVPLRLAIVFALAWAAVSAPWIAWNLRHFGSPLYSYAPHVLWTNLGLAQEGIYGDVVTWRWVEPAWGDVAWGDVAWRGLRTMLGSAMALLRGLLLDGGPGTLALAAVAMVAALRTARRTGLARALPVVLYLCLVLPFEFRERFVVPLLPVFYVLAGRGFTLSWKPGRRWFAVLCAATSLAWMVPAYFESPPTRYYSDDAHRRDLYAAMLPVARRLALLEPGRVLAYTSSLDGGIEAVYYHRQLTIRGQPHGRWREEHRGDVLRKLARDFHPRYVWADRITRGELEQTFPGARLVLGNGTFFVFEISGPTAGPAGICDAPPA